MCDPVSPWTAPDFGIPKCVNFSFFSTPDPAVLWTCWIIRKYICDTMPVLDCTYPWIDKKICLKLQLSCYVMWSTVTAVTYNINPQLLLLCNWYNGTTFNPQQQLYPELIIVQYLIHSYSCLQDYMVQYLIHSYGCINYNPQLRLYQLSRYNI
jgi:hypothetical protein